MHFRHRLGIVVLCLALLAKAILASRDAPASGDAEPCSPGDTLCLALSSHPGDLRKPTLSSRKARAQEVTIPNERPCWTRRGQQRANTPGLNHDPPTSSCTPLRTPAPQNKATLCPFCRCGPGPSGHPCPGGCRHSRHQEWVLCSPRSGWPLVLLGCAVWTAALFHAMALIASTFLCPAIEVWRFWA